MDKELFRKPFACEKKTVSFIITESSDDDDEDDDKDGENGENEEKESGPKSYFLRQNKPRTQLYNAPIEGLYLCMIYCNGPKFLDRYVWANSADPDQTAPRGAD